MTTAAATAYRFRTENAHSFSALKCRKAMKQRSFRDKSTYGRGIQDNVLLDYVVDILEPRNPDFKDNLGKAKGFAEYARQNPGVGRIQLIRMGKDAAGNNRFKRLDMAKGAIRNKLLKATSTEELDHLFDTDGQFGA